MLRRDLGIALRYIHSHLFTHRPFILTHAVTGQCNCSCRICDTWRRPPDPSEMTTQEIFSLLDQAADARFAAYVAFGGEPLMRADIVEVLAHARDKRLYTILITNGALLEEMAEDLAPCTDLTIVSLDDTGQGHDTARATPGLFDAAAAGIAAMQRQHARVMLNCVVSRFSPGGAGRVLGYACQHGLRVAFDPMELFPGVNDEGMTPPEEKKEIFTYLCREKAAGAPILNSAEFLQHQYAPRAYSCAQARIFLRVGADGAVRPFWCQKNASLLGNVRTHRLSDILSSPSWKEFDAVAEGCSRCTNSSTVESSLFYSAGFWASRRYIRFAADYAWHR